MAVEVTQVVAVVLPSVVSALVGALVGRLREARRRGRETDEAREAEHRALMDGMREVMRAQLWDLHRRFVVEGASMPYDEKEHVDSVYRVYHALGGNGTGTHLYNELMQAKVGDAATGGGRVGQHG